MKNIIILLCLSGSVKAQPSACPILQSFNGEWRYVNGQDTIRVYLRYHICNSKNADGSDDFIPALWGWHEYKKGNIVIESNYSNRFITLPANYDDIVSNSYSITLQRYNCDTTRHRMIGHIDDITQCYESKSVIIQFNAALNQITWKQEHPTGYGFMTGCKGMTFPKNFVLTKQ